MYCPACGTRVDSSSRFCAVCGTRINQTPEGTKQQNATVEFIPATCPKCGGELRVPKNMDVVKCNYCGVDVILRDMNKSKVYLGVKIENMKILAKDAEIRQNYTEAIKYYSLVLEDNPECSGAWLGKGYSIAMLSTQNLPRFEEGRSLIEKGLDICETKENILYREVNPTNSKQDSSDNWDKLINDAVKYLDAIAAYGESIAENVQIPEPVDINLMKICGKAFRTKSDLEWDVFNISVYAYHLLLEIGKQEVDSVSRSSLAGRIQLAILCSLGNLRVSESCFGTTNSSVGMLELKVYKAEDILKRWTDLWDVQEIKGVIDRFNQQVDELKKPKKKESLWNKLFP